jgi:hypothetical protein
MKTRIIDKAALAALSWVDLKAYLDLAGWRHTGDLAGKAAAYDKDDPSGRPWEILVPLRDDVADYAARMADAVEALARVEERDELAVYADLSASGADVVRLQAYQADAEGTISLPHGVALYREAENLVLAAACAAREPRRSYHPRKIAEVRSYLEGVRLGPNERGSFVITIHSPIAPALRNGDQPTLGQDFEDEPFPRLVTLKLSEALDTARGAVSRAVAEKTFDAFEKAVTRGVNANLCDALARLTEHGAGLDVRIAWARVRPTAGPPRHFRFSRELGRVLEEAAAEFRRTDPKLDERIAGFVIQLARPPEQFDGRATLRTLLDGKPRRVAVVFEPQEYEKVLRAHGERVAVSLDGDLYPTGPMGQRWELRNPRNLVLLDEPSDREDPEVDESMAAASGK